jgi:hypothetical protein
MGFDNTDKSFAVKVSSLFLVLAISLLVNKLQPAVKNINQDIIKIENNKPSVIQTISIKKTSSQQLYNNPLR